MTICPVCGVPQADAWMCSVCAKQITDALALVAPSSAPQQARSNPQEARTATKPVSKGDGRQTLPWEARKQSWAGFEEELLISLARLDKHGPNLAYGRSAETPLPYSEAASDAAHELRRTLASWVITLCDPNWYPADTLTGMAGWLIDNIEAIRHSTYSADAHTQLTGAIHSVLLAIGPRVARDATPVNEELLAQAPDTHATKQEILSALPDVCDRRFRNWLLRGKIAPVGLRADKPLYRVGDALTLAKATRKAAA